MNGQSEEDPEENSHFNQAVRLIEIRQQMQLGESFCL